LDTTDEAAWRKVWLAGDVLLEMGLQRTADSALGRDLLSRLQRRLAELLQSGQLAPLERARAGDTLARLGDPHFDPQHWFLPAGDPLLGFVEVPAGQFWMGSDKKLDKETFDDEFPRHSLALPAYYIARYPVTVAQFRRFVEETHTGFDRWQWNPVLNHPVVGVAWYEALQYCRWLDEKLREEAREMGTRDRGMGDEAAHRFWEGLANGKLAVTLPSEAEWEKAARGTDGRIYPWGNQFDPDKANTSETGLGGTSPVGCFPGGASPYGLLDASGNVWEWTRSLWNKYPYPESGGELAKREDLAAPGITNRVVRGGAFSYDLRYARCACRYWLDPLLRGRNLGFRVVVSPLPLDSGRSGSMGL
jgi:formylglycine-generating enzyme required for sulfatase activity